ncbi:MAG: UvrB/UvrC motif-containing protein [Verrucomicrobiota bacterium]
MNKAIETEDFEQAAQLRDRDQTIEQPAAFSRGLN